MNKKRKRILFVYPIFSTFVKADYEILSENFDVVKYQYHHKKSVLNHLLEQIKFFFFLVKNISAVDAVFIWFADYHSFLPILFAKIFNKKSFLVLGGYDVTFLPKFNYGSFNNPLRAFCARYSLNNATLNLAVAENIKRDAEERASKAKTKVLYTGYDARKFTYDEQTERSGVLSVLGAYTKQRLYIKGADLLAATAKKLKDVTFTLVAIDEKLFAEEFGVIPNVNFIGNLPQEDLAKLYAQTSVYAQFSLREGLPNSVCEAMLCGAIPVGTNVGGIPTAIGECGYLIDERDANAAAEAITAALNAPNEMRICARERIIENFPFERREKELTKLITKYLNNEKVQ